MQYPMATSSNQSSSEILSSDFALGPQQFPRASMADHNYADRSDVAQDRLEQSNRDLQQFAYIVSHDLQAPLRAIEGYCRLLQDKLADNCDEETKDFLEKAANGAQQMRSMINGILAFARVTTCGKTPEPIDCEVIFEQTITNLKALIEETQATITHDPLPVIPADAVQLVQVVQNLIENAIKYRGSNPPTIHLSAQNRENDWLFSVRDNGIGIEAKDVDRIFVILQRLHSQAEIPGTGLGLAVCKRIVERHGGEMWVESQPNSGSTFYFTIVKSMQ
jgi:light-regulated signal transduction histidine kinase (bacteriophytochrome)